MMMAMTMIITEKMINIITEKTVRTTNIITGKDGGSDSDDEITEQPQRGGSTTA
jgi:hypothetical protein